MIYLLDTSALIRYLSESGSISSRAVEVIDDLEEGDRLAVPTIALVEAWDLSRKQRRDYVPFDEVMRRVSDLNMMVVDLTLSIIRLLPDEWTDTHDMIVLATALDMQARLGDVAIISSDRNMRFNQAIVPCIW